jgi:hypothetical protein
MIGHSSSSKQDIIIMFIIMIIAAIISGMNMWVNNINDVRIHLNDIYMGILMTGWMFLLMGIFYSMNNYTIVGITTIIITTYLIRTQTFIDENQYLTSMIPHHSMAVFMSKKLKEKNIVNNDIINSLIDNIILTQEQEINIMKNN